MKQGLIALDIDGTLTDSQHQIPPEVITYLHNLYDEGWKIILLTGRPLSFASHVLHHFNFSFYLAIQNGADILEMPNKTLAERAYLDAPIIVKLDTLYKDLPTDFLIYSGFEGGDFCYYRSKNFPASMASYLEKLETLSDAPWRDCENFQLEQTAFPLIKCIGLYDDMKEMQAKLEGMTTSLIRDPVSDGYYYLILVTHPNATKGKALNQIRSYLDIAGPVIAAGDDTNDIPMLKEADIAIAMETGPQEVLDHGNIIAKPSTELGIIDALSTAISRC